MASEDEIYSDSDGGSYCGDYDDDAYDSLIEEEEQGAQVPDGRQEAYTVLIESDIRRRIHDSIVEVSAVLSISEIEASILLLHYNWHVGKLSDAWFGDEEGTRKKVGLFAVPVVELCDGDYTITCLICFESYPRASFTSTTCGHPYCRHCWRSYISISINDGAGCLRLKCPDPSCRAAVGRDMVDTLASKEEKERYSGFLMMAYIQENKMIKWCPAPGCEHAIDFVAGSGNFDVSCLCSHGFCWNCCEEAHRPVDCKTVMKWMLKNQSESENVNYIMAFTKPCPKCKKPIEKNQGCNHMTCAHPCGYEFCWLCLEKWTGYDHKCNTFPKLELGQVKKVNMKKYMERYTHYFERWATHRSSMKKAIEDLRAGKADWFEKLSNMRCAAGGQVHLKFIAEAWEQIVECRRVLTWTYAYGYYLPDKENPKTKLFEYLQGQAENGLERLHDCAEIELSRFLDAADDKQSPEEFIDFKKKLTGLTAATRNYFENLVTALENGLSEVKVKPGHCYTVPNRYTSSFLKSAEVEPHQHHHDHDEDDDDGGDDDDGDDVADYQVDSSDMEAIETEPVGPWTCGHCRHTNDGSELICVSCEESDWYCESCTYSNDRTASECALCSRPRPKFAAD